MRRTQRLCTLILAAISLAGCAGDGYWGARAYVVPGRFNAQTCEQLDGTIRSTQTRLDELSVVRDKADRDASGTLISPVVYGPTLANLRAELQVLRETRDEKKCPPAKR